MQIGVTVLRASFSTHRPLKRGEIVRQPAAPAHGKHNNGSASPNSYSMAAPPKPLSVDIHTSVKEGDMAKVFEFLEEGGDVNVRCRCDYRVALPTWDTNCSSVGES